MTAIEYLEPETIEAAELLELVNRAYPRDVLVICVLCDHLDHHHGYEFHDSCRCCRTTPKGAALPVRFARRTQILTDVVTGAELHVKCPLAPVWPRA